jgi:hypothetical protein
LSADWEFGRCFQLVVAHVSHIRRRAEQLAHFGAQAGRAVQDAGQKMPEIGGKLNGMRFANRGGFAPGWPEKGGFTLLI